MNPYNKKSYLVHVPMILCIAALFLVSACASVPLENKALERARNAYQTTKSTTNIETLAPVALYDAEIALEKAENATKDIQKLEHLAYIAEKKAQIAVLIAEGKFAEAEMAKLSKSKDKIVLLSREKETTAALAKAEERTLEAELAKKHSEAMMQDAKEARFQADEARMKTEETLAEKQQIEKELAELQAKQTDRGAVITLGNILFEFNKSALLPGGFMVIDKLSEFLKKYPSKDLSIEGHTDSQGSDTYNQGLSQQRANSVFSALVQRGIESHRMTQIGHGEQYPVASNETQAGRQQNRRVEVIILNEAAKIQ
ncbi:MAG: OmpA family protein [Desulfobacterium sp.]|nr:OmpA family protein [Desulfobacterium sp.]